MTIWLPNLRRSGTPIYIEIADAIEQDIASGKLAPGEKLPPVRNVAFDIGVTVGTVSRAYALARERGLVSGEVGRGTYILDTSDVPEQQPETFAPDINDQHEITASSLPKPRGKDRTNLPARLSPGPPQQNRHTGRG